MAFYVFMFNAFVGRIREATDPELDGSKDYIKLILIYSLS
jgi:hypothetical protein